MTQNSPIYFEIFLENIDYTHPSETPETKPAQKRAGSTMHPSKTPDLAKNYTLSVNMAKESLVTLHQMHRIKNMTNF